MLATCALLLLPLADGEISPKVHPELRKRIEAEAFAPDEERMYRVYAVLSERLRPTDLEPELEGLRRKERQAHVVDRLRAFADERQQGIQRVLDELESEGSVDRVHQLWIANAVVFRGTPEAIDRVAHLEEVERIGWDPPRDPAEIEDGPVGPPQPRLALAPTTPQVFYEQDFESGSLGPEFSTSTTNCGVIELTGDHGPVEDYHVVMYTSVNGCESEASLTLTVDLSTATTASLRFSFKDIDDEFDSGFDKVEVSDDGGSIWTHVADLSAVVENVHAPQTHLLDGLGVSYVSNFMVRWSWQDASVPPNDGFGIDNIAIQDFFDTTPPPAPQPNLVQHQATDLWELGYTGQGITILNIDRGVDYRHPDLAGRIFVNPLDPIDGVDNDSNGYIDDHMGWDWIEDDNDPLPNFFYGEHGTNTAGIMVGDGASGLARTGMAPGANLAIGRINGEAQQWLAIQWGLSVGIDCHSSSNSYRWDLVPRPDFHMHRVVHDMLLTAGVIQANSIGNYAGSSVQPIPFQITIPGACPAPWSHPDQVQGGGAVSAIMAVGGIELDDTLFAPSSIGPCAWEDVTVYDSGYPHTQDPAYWDFPYGGFGGSQEGILKPDVVAYSNVVTTDGPSGYLSSFWGTSASTPHVGGAFALLLSVCPEATPAELCEALQTTAIDMGPPGKDNTYGAGRIQVFDAALMLVCITEEDDYEQNDFCAIARPITEGTHSGLFLTAPSSPGAYDGDLNNARCFAGGGRKRSWRRGVVRGESKARRRRTAANRCAIKSAKTPRPR